MHVFGEKQEGLMLNIFFIVLLESLRWRCCAALTVFVLVVTIIQNAYGFGCTIACSRIAK